MKHFQESSLVSNTMTGMKQNAHRHQNEMDRGQVNFWGNRPEYSKQLRIKIYRLFVAQKTQYRISAVLKAKILVYITCMY